MYVEKIDGKIVAAFQNPNSRATHEVADDDAALLSFYNPDILLSEFQLQKKELKNRVNERAQEIRWSPVPFSRTVEGGDDIDTAVQFRGPDDFINLSALKNSIDNGATEVTVIMEDNVVYTLTAAEFNAMWAAGLTRNQTAAVTARNIKNSIDEATTQAQLDAAEAALNAMV